MGNLGYHVRMTTTPKIAYSKKQKMSGFGGRHRKLWAASLVIVSLLILSSITLRYVANLGKFSDKDYSAIETAVENVFKKVGADNTDKYKYCSYEAPQKYSRVRLYCGIEIAGYLKYENNNQAISVGKNLEKEITKTVGRNLLSFDSFYTQPANGSANIVTQLQPPLRQKQCNFYINSQEKAKFPVGDLPEKKADNLIALSFTCSAESRKAYFPVIYRQGS